jgi:hypothetical protein
VVIIEVDPHERTHTASALEPGTHRVVATVQNAGNGTAGRPGVALASPRPSR